MKKYDAKLLVHHVNLKHRFEDRSQVEKDCCAKTIDWLLTKGYKFDVHQSTFFYGDLPKIAIKDIQIVSVFTAIIFRTYQVDNLLLSWHKGEVNREDINKGFRVRKVLEALESPMPKFVFPIENMTRADMVAVLPKKLYEFVSSCRTPRGVDPCGKCVTCLEYLNQKLSLPKPIL